jgi:DNA-binding NarL/FixJ family response regulator
MTKTELAGPIRRALEIRHTELGTGNRDRKAIAIEASSDKLGGVQHAGDRDCAISKLGRNSNQLCEKFRMPCDVLIVDDHKIMRDGIRAILERSEEFSVVGEAETGTEAVQFVKLMRPKLILMDIGLPDMNGVETTAEIRRYDPDCRVIILTIYDDENSVVSAFRSGARAFILKKASYTDLLEALRVVARGGAYLSPQVSDRLLARIQKGDLESGQTQPALESLSRRELQALRLVADGKTSKEIAVMLDLREQTVRTYRKTMMKKLGVNNVARLTQLAFSTGLTRLSSPAVAAIPAMALSISAPAAPVSVTFPFLDDVNGRHGAQSVPLRINGN